jgi:hypothetical protein
LFISGKFNDFFHKEKNMLKIILTTALLLLLGSIATAQIKSVYTSLDEKHCKSLKPVPDSDVIYISSYNRICSGVGGYRLALDLDLDKGQDHQWIALVAPSGRKFDAGIGPDAYNSVGKTAEWRVRNGRPIALIIRFDLRNESGGEITSSVLAVSKISRSMGCVVATVDGDKDSTRQARKLADSSASKRCLPYLGFMRISKPVS